MHCIFCHDIPAEQMLMTSEHFYVVFDIDPIQVGHLLIIAKNHVIDVRAVTAEQALELLDIQTRILTIFEQHFSIPSATIVQNNGPIMDEGTHFHVHVIPRYIDDAFWTSQRVKQHTLSQQQLKRAFTE